MNHQKRLGLLVLAVLIGGGTALAPFSQAAPAHPVTAHAAAGHPAPGWATAGAFHPSR